MLRRKSKLFVTIHRLLDTSTTAFAFICAYFIKRDFLPESIQGLSTSPNYYIVLLMIVIVWHLTFNAYGIYSSRRAKTLGTIFYELLLAVSTGMLILFLCMFIFKMTDISRIMMGLFYLLNIGLLILINGVVYISLMRYRSKGLNYRSVLIIGSRSGAREAIDAIGDRREAGYKILGCLETARKEIGRSVKNGVSVIGTVDQLKQILTNQVVDELIFSMPLRDIENVEEYIALAEKIGIPVRVMPQWWPKKHAYIPKIGKFGIENFLGIPTLCISTTPENDWTYLIKRIADYVLAIVFMILTFPIFVLISVALKILSKGPVFFTQERCGMNGRRFRVYKFRTMVTGAEQKQAEILHMNESDGPVFKIGNDPRIIPYIGKFLRKTGLDELPQLINVLKGEMGIVGPRPPIPNEVEKYDTWQRRRLSIRPGMTCLWQTTTGRNDMSFEEWMKLDLEYIDNWCLSLDLKILFKTVWVVLKREGR